MIRVTKIFNFEMAHALWNYNGPCKNIHGHSYKLLVTVSGIPMSDDKNMKLGMLIDFGDLKKIVRKSIIERFDHSVVVSKNAPHNFMQNIEQMFDKYELSDYQPTCENMVAHFAKIISDKLPAEVFLHNLRLYETENSYAEWFSSDNR